MQRTTTALIIAAAIAGIVPALPVTVSAQVSVSMSVDIGPPPLPYYPQPYAPAPDYIWTPGYWAYGPYGYYWVPGTWVLAPAFGLLWTPGWWGWEAGFYRWHHGYWGPHVGYYGGINYGYGYTGRGYEGGYWRGHDFYYNRAVNNIDPDHARYAYDGPANNRTEASRISYNGGEGGVRFQPTPDQETYAREPHTFATPAQKQQESLAQANPAQRYSMNHGRPEIAATARPGKFKGSDVVRMNKEQDSYVYKPGQQPNRGSRGGEPSPRVSQPVEHAPKPDQNMNRVYKPDTQPTRGGRVGEPSPPVSRPVEHVPTPDLNMNRNEKRAGEGRTTRPENSYDKQPGQPHARPPEAKRPPEHKKHDDGNRPPR